MSAMLPGQIPAEKERERESIEKKKILHKIYHRLYQRSNCIFWLTCIHQWTFPTVMSLIDHTLSLIYDQYGDMWWGLHRIYVTTKYDLPSRRILITFWSFLAQVCRSRSMASLRARAFSSSWSRLRHWPIVWATYWRSQLCTKSKYNAIRNYYFTYRSRSSCHSQSVDNICLS